jgi:Na+/melibiose symporter-like transporter
MKRIEFWVQIGSAIFMLIVGVALACIGFATPPVGEISDSVLWLFSQCLIYAGSVFGVGAYINHKFAEMKNKMNKAKSETT